MPAVPVPQPAAYRVVRTIAVRNAIPSSQRMEGMAVYVVDRQLTYQLLPPPWAGTDDDWVLFGQIPAYTDPILLTFWMENTDDPAVPIDQKWIGHR